MINASATEINDNNSLEHTDQSSLFLINFLSLLHFEV